MVEFLDEHGIRATTVQGLHRHGAMNLVEHAEVRVPSTELDLAASLIDRAPELFPGATSYSEPLRYSRGMWGRVRHVSPVARLGYFVFVGITAMLLLGFVVLLISVLVASAT